MSDEQNSKELKSRNGARAIETIKGLFQKIRRNRLVPSIVLAVFGSAMISWSSYQLVVIFSESTVQSKSLIVTLETGCRVPNDVMLVIHARTSGEVLASIFPSYNKDDFEGPHCLKIASDQPFAISPKQEAVWGDAERSKKPEVKRVNVGSKEELWATLAYFPSPPKPVEGGFQPIRRNIALSLIFDLGLSRPAYTKGVLKMSVSFIPLLGPKRFLVSYDKGFELSSVETMNEYKSRGRNVSLDLNHGLCLFEVNLRDTERERRKEIILLLAGGLLILGLGCIVDLVVKLLELRAKKPD